MTDMTDDSLSMLADFERRLERLRQQARNNREFRTRPVRKSKARPTVGGSRRSKARKPYYHPGHPND